METTFFCKLTLFSTHSKLLILRRGELQFARTKLNYSSNINRLYIYVENEINEESIIMLKSVAIFCGSSFGTEPIYREQAEYVGQVLAEQGIQLIYGGGKVGLMGVVADACLAHGGQVIGVMTRHLVEKETAHYNLTELHIVENMHERKQKMSELADGFIALAGGIGTLEEIFEQWTWAQIGLHQKPCAFLNTHDFYQPLFQFIDTMVTQGFVRQINVDKLIKHHDIEEILQQMRQYQAPLGKWDNKSE